MGSQHFNVIFQQEYYPTNDEVDDELDYGYYIGFTNQDYFIKHALTQIQQKFAVTFSSYKVEP